MLPEDLTRLAEELRLAPARAPRTASWFKEWARLAAQSQTKKTGKADCENSPRVEGVHTGGDTCARR